jgi:hypothetical protein
MSSPYSRLLRKCHCFAGIRGNLSFYVWCAEEVILKIHYSIFRLPSSFATYGYRYCVSSIAVFTSTQLQVCHKRIVHSKNKLLNLYTSRTVTNRIFLWSSHKTRKTLSINQHTFWQPQQELWCLLECGTLSNLMRKPPCGIRLWAMGATENLCFSNNVTTGI